MKNSFEFTKKFPANFPKPRGGKIDNEALAAYLFSGVKVTKKVVAGMMYIWVTISPEMAERLLLGTTTGNRDLRWKDIYQIVEDILNGDFRNAVSDPVIFGWDGKIISGQHRLVAIIIAGVTISDKFLVELGMDPQANMRVDRGAKRSIRDGMHYEGVECSFGQKKAQSRSRAYDLCSQSRTIGNYNKKILIIKNRIGLMEKVNSAVTQTSNGVPLPEHEQPCKWAGTHAAFMIGYELFGEPILDIARVLGSGKYDRDSAYGIFHQWINYKSQPGKTLGGNELVKESFAATIGLFRFVMARKTPSSRGQIKATEKQIDNFLAGKLPASTAA